MIKNTLLYGLLFFALSPFAGLAQEGISFHEGELTSIMRMAIAQEKSVFIDTYAEWCVPCKRMKEKFKDPEVGAFFNKHFINYRVNMQDPSKSKALHKKYDIVFLPTMLIVDSKGKVKYKVDRELTIDELLTMGTKALDPNSYDLSEATPVRRNTSSSLNRKNNKKYPKGMVSSENGATKTGNDNSSMASMEITRKTEPTSQLESIDNSDGKIIAILGDEELPPEILKAEAYLRLEFMDGSHLKAANTYLATQTDWNTKENRKFILDFLHSTSSREYSFIVSNRAEFDRQFGKETVQKSLEIVTYKALYNAVPRPSLREAEVLFKNVQVKNPHQSAYYYFINRLIGEDNPVKVLEVCDGYVDKYPEDHAILYNVASYLTHRQVRNSSQLNKAMEYMETATSLKPNHSLYLELLSEIYTIQNRKKLAESTLLKAHEAGKNKYLH